MTFSSHILKSFALVLSTTVILGGGAPWAMAFDGGESQGDAVDASPEKTPVVLEPPDSPKEESENGRQASAAEVTGEPGLEGKQQEVAASSDSPAEPALLAEAAEGRQIASVAGPEPTKVLKAQISNLEEINRQILLKEIELERYSINFRKLNNIQGRWRGWRYFLSQEASAAGTAAGLVQQMVDRQRVLNNNYVFVVNNKGKIAFQQNRTNRGREEAGLVSQMVGQFIGCAGSGVELGINVFHEYKARKAGYSPKAGIARALSIKAELEQLFVERRRLVQAAHLSVSAQAVAEAEEKVLRDLTDMGLQEYAVFHAQARRFQAFQDSLYVFDMLRNSTGALGNLVNIYGTHYRVAKAPGAAGVLSGVSAFFVMFGPILSRGCGKLVESSHKRALRPVLAGTSPHSLENLEADQKVLAALIEERKSLHKDCSETALNLLAAYDQQGRLKHDQLALATREIRAGTRAATENVEVGLAVGSTKMYLSITNMIAGWRNFRSPFRQNAIIQTGTYAYTAGSFLSVGDNVRLRLKDEFNRHRLGRQRLLPMQVLGDRLKALDTIEASLKNGCGQP